MARSSPQAGRQQEEERVNRQSQYQPESQIPSGRRSDRNQQLSGNHVEPETLYPDIGAENGAYYTQVNTHTQYTQPLVHTKEATQSSFSQTSAEMSFVEPQASGHV